MVILYDKVFGGGRGGGLKNYFNVFKSAHVAVIISVQPIHLGLRLQKYIIF